MDEQFTKADVQKTNTIANKRIFVELAIRRLKTFRIIKNELPIYLIGNLDSNLDIGNLDRGEGCNLLIQTFSASSGITQ